MYRIKVFSASSGLDAYSKVPDTVAQLHEMAHALRDAYPSHTIIVQRHRRSEWEDFRIVSKRGSIEGQLS